MRRTFALALAFASLSVAAWAQATSPFAISGQTTVSIPLGPTLSDGTPLYFAVGGGASIRAEYTPPFAPFLFAGAGLDATVIPLNFLPGHDLAAATYLSLGPALGVQFFPVPRLGVRAMATGGMYFGAVSGVTVTNPWVGAAVDVGYQVTPALAITLGGNFSYLFTISTPALVGTGVTAGVRYYVGGKKADLRIEPRLEPVFPVFYGYYDANPAGTVLLTNNSMGAIENLRVSLYVKEYMTTAKPSEVLAKVPRGSQIPINVNALFTTEILSVTEQKKVAGELTVTYSYFGTEVKNTYPVTLIIEPRNGMTWDKTEKAASFVTTNDDRVRNFAAPYAADARDKGQLAISWRFRVAMALFEALKTYGVGYVADATPFAQRSQAKETVDLLRFPVETLVARVGDCDDLSILYAALLEASGVQAAFVTTPGHIYVAFNLGLDQASARSTFSRPEDLLFLGDRGIWLPVEVTQVREGFLRAWRDAAQEWKAADANKQAELLPLQTAWQSYSPVDTGRILQGSIMAPDSVRVFQNYSASLNQLYTADFKPRIDELSASLKKAPNDAKLLNRMGVLYARFGMLKEARTQFEQIVKTNKSAPSPVLINLGNIAYLDGRYQDAYDFYCKALDTNPDSMVALLGKARAGYELGKGADVQDAFDRLTKVSPDTAKEYAYLGGGGGARAASAEKEVSEWSDE